MCLEIYKLYPAKFLSALRLAWQAASKKTKVRLDLLTDIDDMLLIVEKGICFDRILRSVHKHKFKLYIAFNTNLLSIH